MSQELISQPLRLGNHLVAGYWRYLLPEELQQLKYPAERRSACMNCPKVVSDQFRQDYRCCTYFPRVPNFALGLALIFEPQSAPVIKKLIKDGFILPEGMIASPDKWASYHVEVEEERYGKSDKILCPFLDRSNGYCKIYPFRNSVCSTFFCLKDAGDCGEKFWDELQSLGSQCELALGQWVMEKADLCPDEYYENLDLMNPKEVVSQKDQSWTRASRKVLWGSWFGKEEAFLRRCADIIMENKSHLWSIANHAQIREALSFEKKSVTRVPAKHRAEARAEFNDEEGETVPPWKIWNQVLKTHSKLWTSPGGLMKLSDKITITDNTRQSETDSYWNQHTQKVIYYSGTGKNKETSDVEYISEQESHALMLFSQLRSIDANLRNEIRTLTQRDPEDFLSEWNHKKVIVAHKASGKSCPPPQV